MFVGLCTLRTATKFELLDSACTAAYGCLVSVASPGQEKKASKMYVNILNKSATTALLQGLL